jgi:hypothetical protein
MASSVVNKDRATGGKAAVPVTDSDGNKSLAMAVVKVKADGTVADADPSSYWSYAAATSGIVNTTTAVTIKTAAGAGIRNYLSSLSISHDALGGATEIAIRDGAAGTVLWRGKLQTTAAEEKTIAFNPPLKGTANTLLEVVTLTAVTGGVFVNAQGFTGA